MKKYPDFDNMNVYEMGKYYFDLGEFEKAKKTLEDCINKYEVSSVQMFDLMLQCCVELNQREDYLRIHRKYSLISGIHEPDFKYLDRYLRIIQDAMFIISGKDKKGKNIFGSGFSITRDKIITEYKLFESVNLEDIKVTGYLRPIGVKEIINHPDEKIAVLVMDDILKQQLHIGEFSFAEPGEDVVLVGFIKQEPLNFNNSISISKSKIEKIEKAPSSDISEITLKKKIKTCYSGGPLINELGSVIGVMTRDNTSDEKTVVLPIIDII